MSVAQIPFPQDSHPSLRLLRKSLTKRHSIRNGSNPPVYASWFLSIHFTPSLEVSLTSQQVLTVNILLGWTFYVVSLSQAGKGSALSALEDAGIGAGEGNMGLMEGRRGMGVFSAGAGGEPSTSLGEDAS